MLYWCYKIDWSVNGLEQVLFINSCMRDKTISRTYRMVDVFLKAYQQRHPEANITERDLNQENIHCLYGSDIEYRDRLLAKREFSASFFQYANEFAKADKIVIAAPFWDLAFPAILKVYIENICADGITFGSTPQGLVGLCKAEKLLYITARGGLYAKGEGAAMEIGEKYLRALCRMLGINSFQSIAAEGLDIVGFDTKGIMAEAESQAKELAVIW